MTKFDNSKNYKQKVKDRSWVLEILKKYAALRLTIAIEIDLSPI